MTSQPTPALPTRLRIGWAALGLSFGGFLVSVNLGLILMAGATVITLLALSGVGGGKKSHAESRKELSATATATRTEIETETETETATATATATEKPTRVGLWWAWAVHLLILSGVYMVTYGVANIVGSGRYKSARMAVSTARTLHWAQRQCVDIARRPCTLEELNGSRAIAGKHHLLLRSGFKELSATKQGAVASVGLYHYALYHLETSADADADPLARSSRRAPRWVFYAWPRSDRTIQSFCIDEYEEILELPISPESGSLYLGLERAPAPRACLGALHRDPTPPPTPAQLEARARGAKPPPSTHIGADRYTWQRWRGKRTRYARSRDASRLR